MISTLLLVLAVALSISFLCSLAEACVLSLGSADLASMESAHPRRAGLWRKLKARLDRPLAAILILNTLAHTIGAALAGAQFEQLSPGRGLFLFSLVISFVMIQWTEILPKTIGARHRQTLAVLIGRPLEWAVRLLSPAVWLVHLLNRPFESRTRSPEPSTTEEIEALANFALLSREIERPQQRLISGATELSERTAGDIMIPRDEVSFLPASMNLSQALAKSHLDAHTRYPLTEGEDPDLVIGYVNFKELVAALRTNPENATLRGIARPIRSFSPDEKASTLLGYFVREHQHIALIRDQGPGKLLGLVTLEDVLEVPLGEIRSEYDLLPAMVHPLGEGLFMLGGGLRMEEVSRKLGLPLGDATGSLSEWLEARLGHAPKVNDAVEFQGVRFSVRRVRRRKVFEATAKADGAGERSAEPVAGRPR